MFLKVEITLILGSKPQPWNKHAAHHHSVLLLLLLSSSILNCTLSEPSSAFYSTFWKFTSSAFSILSPPFSTPRHHFHLCEMRTRYRTLPNTKPAEQRVLLGGFHCCTARLCLSRLGSAQIELVLYWTSEKFLSPTHTHLWYTRAQWEVDLGLQLCLPAHFSSQHLL